MQFDMRRSSPGASMQIDSSESPMGNLGGRNAPLKRANSGTFSVEETPSFFDNFNRKLGQKSNSNTFDGRNQDEFIPFGLSAHHNLLGEDQEFENEESNFGLRNRFNKQRSPSTQQSLFRKSSDRLFNPVDENRLPEIADQDSQIDVSHSFLPPKKSLFSKQSPETKMKDISQRNERASLLMGVDISKKVGGTEASQSEANKWVTVYGFDTNLTSFIIDFFNKIGMVEEMKQFKNSNFLFIKYTSHESAVAALSQNGSLLKLGGYNLFIGVKSGHDAEQLLSDLKESENISNLRNSKKTLPGSKKVQLVKSFRFTSGSDWWQLVCKVLEWIFIGR